MAARSSLRTFLVQAKANLRAAIQEQGKKKITLVIGNESADLDSLTSSLLFAYFRSAQPPKNAFSPLYIPVTNIPYADINLRPEFKAVLSHANVPADHLITLDDLPPQSDLTRALPPESTHWILVDHNALQGQLGKIYGDRVAGVIDHHDEENKVPRDTAPEPRIVEKCGSCTSLVVNNVRDVWDQIAEASLESSGAHAQTDNDEVVNDAAFTKKWDAQIAQLAMASVLIDTNNLADESKVCEQDMQAVEYLEARIMACPQFAASTFTRDAYFDEISAAKRNLEPLSLVDILRKDYKQWDQNRVGKLGIGSVVKPIEWLIKKADDSENDGEDNTVRFVEAITGFARDRDLAIFAIMTTSTADDGSFRRQLLVVAKDEKAIEAAKNFEESSRKELGLKRLEDLIREKALENSKACGFWARCWEQQETKHSRKRVAPLLREAMK